MGEWSAASLIATMSGLKLCVLWIALLGAASGCLKESHGPCTCEPEFPFGRSSTNAVVTCSGVTSDWLIKDALWEFRLDEIALLEIRDSPELSFLSDDVFERKEIVKMLIMRSTGLQTLRASPFVLPGIADQLDVLSIVDSQLETLDAAVVNEFKNLKWLEFRRNSKLTKLSGTLSKNTEL